MNKVIDLKSYVDTCTTKFCFAEISADQVVDEINAISENKASGLDTICTKLVKYGAKSTAEILCKICLKKMMFSRWFKSCSSDSNIQKW